MRLSAISRVRSIKVRLFFVVAFRLHLFDTSQTLVRNSFLHFFNDFLIEDIAKMVSTHLF